MKITGIEIFHVHLPMRREHRSAVGDERKAAGSYPVIKLKTDKGIVGLGDSSPLKEWGGAHGTYFGESAGMVMMVIRDYLMPAIEGQDPFRIEWIHTLMDRATKGHVYAKAAVDIALHDIVGKALNTPVYQLLGGMYRDRVPIAHSLGIMPIEKAAAESRWHGSRGQAVRVTLREGEAPGRARLPPSRVRPDIR